MRSERSLHCNEPFLMKSVVNISIDTIVDATVVRAPSSTKDADRARDPEMLQTKKGNDQSSK